MRNTDPDDSEQLLDSEIRRKKLGIWIAVGLVAALLVLAVAGHDIVSMLRGGDKADEGSKPTANGGSEQPQGQTPTAPANGAGQGAADGSGSTPTPQVTDAEAFRPSAKSLRPQSEAKQTELMGVVAYPWKEVRDGASGMPTDKRWLADTTALIGRALSDNNRALEEGPTINAERALPRMGDTLRPIDLPMIGLAGELKHVIVVEYLLDGSGWVIHRHSYGDERGKSSAKRAWPEKDVVATLMDDIVGGLEHLTGYALSASGAYTVRDDAAKALAAMEATLASEGNSMGSPTKRAAEAQLEAILKLDPGFDFAVYRLAIRLAESDMKTPAIELLRDRMAQGSKSVRVRQVLATLMAGSVDASLRQQGLALAKMIFDEDALNMAAYTYWAQAWFAGNADPSALTGADHQARDGIHRYPEDGRFHAMLAKELSTDPQHWEAALVAIDEAMRLRPYCHSYAFQKGFIMFIRAQDPGRRRSITASARRQEYFDAANVLMEHWSADPNRIADWLELTARALTNGARELPDKPGGPEEPCHELNGFTYMLVLIANAFTPGNYTRMMSALFKEIEPKCRRYVRDLATKAKPGDNNYPLILMADIALHFVVAVESGNPAAHLRTVEAAIDRYRAWGGRARQIEELYQQLQEQKRSNGERAPTPPQPTGD